MVSDDELLTTFAEARHVNVYALARRWADRAGHESTQEHEIDDLATMAALHDWMSRWLPLQVHRAVMAGADVDQVCAATGWTVEQVVDRWREWSAGQKWLWSRDPGCADIRAEHEQIGAVLAAQLRNEKGRD